VRTPPIVAVLVPQAEERVITGPDVRQCEVPVLVRAGHISGTSRADGDGVVAVEQAHQHILQGAAGERIDHAPPHHAAVQVVAGAQHIGEAARAVAFGQVLHHLANGERIGGAGSQRLLQCDAHLPRAFQTHIGHDGQWRRHEQAFPHAVQRDPFIEPEQDAVTVEVT
jgi:hypothetical protein